LTSRDALIEFDLDQRAAILTAYQLSPDKPIEMITREVADQFRERWRSMFKGWNPRSDVPQTYE
jgi:hypothetical protein